MSGHLKAAETAAPRRIAARIAAVESDVSANTTAIAAINDASTGILATAKNYTDTKVGPIPASVGETTVANAKEYVDAMCAALEAQIVANASVIYYSETEPTGLTENDLWIQPVGA